MCQRYYDLVLMKELGLDQNTTNMNKTFIHVNTTNN